MFTENVGSTIKSVAKIFFGVDLIASVVSAFVVGFSTYDADSGEGFNPLFWVILLAGIIVAVVSYVFLYGFGDLVETNREILSCIKQESKKPKKPILKKATKEIADPLKDKKEEQGDFIDAFCPECGEQLSIPKTTLTSGEKVACPYCSTQLEINTDFEEKAKKIGKCEICDKNNVKIQRVRIVDEMGTRYRNVCADCFDENTMTIQDE